MKIAILVDEMNAMEQFKGLGFYGLKSWLSFFDVIQAQLRKDFNTNVDVEYHFYGSLPPQHVDRNKHFDRRRFFDRLKYDGIHVHEGFCLKRGDIMKEKGVDILIGLDLFEFSLNQHDLLFLFSGDSDLVPAIQRAQRNSRVVPILSKYQKSVMMRKTSDAILVLENLLERQSGNLIPLKNTKEAI